MQHIDTHLLKILKMSSLENTADIIEHSRNKIALSNSDDKRLKHTHMEKMLIKYVKVKC